MEKKTDLPNIVKPVRIHSLIEKYSFLIEIKQNSNFVHCVPRNSHYLQKAEIKMKLPDFH